MPSFTTSQHSALESFARDLDDVFGARLRALVAYPGSHGDGSVHSCAIVDALSFEDLRKCLPFTSRWHQRRIAVPLMLSQDELPRTLDIFPLEYAAIAADHLVLRGADPFAGLVVPAADLRRATEAQAKSHLIHLREAYLESHGETTRVARLIAASTPSLRALLSNLARLVDGPATTMNATINDDALAGMAETRMGVSPGVIRDVLAASTEGSSMITDPSHLLALYVEASERIWSFVDGWTA
ncbi:MAG TPA: hypothetical protein VGI12_04730 [Vicinamibacterales bacterium]|jgi:hypothetical protein